MQEMKEILTHLFNALYRAMANTLNQFEDDISFNKKDAKKYIQAAEDLKIVDRVTITLSTGEEVTLINH